MVDASTYYLATIGQYTKDLTINGLTRSEWDFAYLFPSSATRDTAIEIKNYFLQNQKIIAERIFIKEIDPYNFWNSLVGILEVIYDIKSKNVKNSIIVDISGGTRIMSIALHYAGTLVNAKIIYILEDKSGERKKLTLPRLKRLKSSPQDSLILKILYKDKIIETQRLLKNKIEEYLQKTQPERKFKTKGLSPPQLSRRLKALVDMGFVEKGYMKGRDIKLTEYGMAYMKYLDLSKKISGLLKHEKR